MSGDLPTYQDAMLPLLRHVEAAAEPVSIMDALPSVAKVMGLTEAQLAVRLPSGTQGAFHNRLHWAKHYMTRAGLLESTRRGRFQLSADGRALLATSPAVVNTALLETIPAFKEWRSREQAPAASGSSSETPAAALSATPEERIEQARQELEANLTADLLDRVRQMDPSDFEELIILLLVKMGYGQGRQEMAKALGGSGDGGVDGVVHQDPLGLDRVYIQAKRYKEGNTIGPGEINGFIGALNVKKASKGLFVTASSFTKQAREHVAVSSVHVVLIDGLQLAELMVRHKVGVVVRETVELKAVDEGFFAD
jgi:restriction system protein